MKHKRLSISNLKVSNSKKMVISIIIMGMAISLLGGCKNQKEVKQGQSEVQVEQEPEKSEPEIETEDVNKDDLEENSNEGGEHVQEEEEVIDYLTCVSGSIVEQELTEEEVSELFCAREISDEVFARINGVSYVENDDIALEDLRYLRLLYAGFDEKTHVGEMIVHASIADDVLEIFQTLYENDYQIEKMCLIDEYGGDDHASLLDNNTSAFNYRVVEGSQKLSKHAYGLAIDINPFYNPYVTYPGGVEHISPEGSEPYADREADFPHKIGKDGDLCWKLFTEHGFTWGGDWKSLKDYQHFQISQ